MIIDKHTKGVLALVFLAFGFGAVAIAVRALGQDFSLYQQLYITIGLAFIFSLFIFPCSLSIAKFKQVPLKDWLIIAFRVIVGYLIGAALYRQALMLTKISNVTFIQSIPFSAIFGWLLFKEGFTIKKLALVISAYFGVVIVSVKDFGSVLSFGKGEIYSLISSALFSLSFVSRKFQSSILNDKQMTQILLVFGAIALVIISVLMGEGVPQINLNSNLFVVILFISLFNAINIYLINYGFGHIKAVLASNILTLEALFALVLAFIFYRELPTIIEFSGGMIIIASVVMMNRLEESPQ